MEKYKILEKYGKGAQGTVYKVKHKENDQISMLKQVECNDESECNRAFKESLCLEDLKHPYICRYKEFFVSWNEEHSAMYVNIVCDFYPRGHIGLYLAVRRDNKNSVDEELIKKWLGQIIQALIFVHKKKMVHRDLKPSNIYISSDDNSLAIGDFGVVTIMKDVRSKTRGSVGMMNWMAPEVLEQPYDEKSDTWAIGCLVLELVTCHLYTAQEIKGKLFEIKHSDETLESLLQEIGEVYSTQLVDVLRRCLNRNYAERPTPRTLLELAYIQRCLSISDTVIVERKRRAASATPAKPVPKDRGIVAVIDYLLDNLHNEGCVKQAMPILVTLTKEEGATIDINSKRVIAKAMKDYITEWDVQMWGCQIFNNLVISANSDDILYTAEIVNLMPILIRHHLEQAEVVKAAATFLTSVSAQEHSSQIIGDCEGVKDILEGMRQFPNHVGVQSSCCSALWSLTVNEDNIRVVTEQRGVYDVINALKTLRCSPEVVESASAALIAISMEDENLDIINRENVVACLLECLDIHQRQAKCVKNICLALVAMVEPDEGCAFNVMTNLREDGEEEPGIPYLTNAYSMHKDNAEVVENICLLFMELCEYDEIRAEIKHLHIGESILNEVHKRFKENKSIMKPCEQALVKLGLKIRLQHPSAKKRS